MSERSRTTALRHMLDHSREAVALAQGKSRSDLDTNRLLNLALVRLLEIVGEAAGRIPKELCALHPEIPYQLMLSAVNRVKIPNLPFRAEYDAAADTLYLRFHDDLKATRSKSDTAKGVIYDYHEKTLVGIEILEASAN